VADPGHADFAGRQVRGLLSHDLDDLATFLDLAV
jgi:hypothetical protein